MSDQSALLGRHPPDFVARGLWGLFFAILITLAASLLLAAPYGSILAAASATFAAILAILLALGWTRATRRAALRRAFLALQGTASGSYVLTDASGRMLWQSGDQDLQSALNDQAADVGEAFETLRARALDRAGQDIVVPAGPAGTQRLSVRSLGGGDLLWRLLPPAASTSHDMGFVSLPIPLLELSETGLVLRANTAATEFLMLSKGETPLLADLVEGIGRPVNDWLAEAVEGRTLGRPEVAQASRGEGDRFLQITLKRMGPRLIAVLQDATEMKTLEGQFVQSQKMQAIGQLAGGVAHDFNNLLTAIRGHCDLLLMRYDEGDPAFADLEQINQNANRAASLVGQLLAFSRKQNLRPENVDIRKSLSNLTHLLDRLVGEKVTLSVRHGEDAAIVRADPRQIDQAIMNLVVNARDAMPEGGAIEITTAREQLESSFTRNRATVPAGDYLVVRVTDRGHGIPPDRLQKIFEPFFTTKRPGEGTGLGLSTVYGIVKQTGGFVFADSVVGKGTTFTLYLPAHNGAATRMPVAPPAQLSAAKQSSGVILLVEDEPPVRAVAARALKMRGFTVLEASSAEEALGLLKDPDLSIDVFLSDVIMPGRDGPSWVKEALTQRPTARTVFMSGYAEEGFTHTQAAIPNSVFLQKPFALADLIETVQLQLR